MPPANDRARSSSESRIEWARQELGLDSSADAAETRRAFLTQVADYSFAPGPTTLQAFEIVQRNSQAPPSPAYQEVKRMRTKERVERFAERIFLFTPIERRKEWEALCEGCEDSPGTSAVLERLQPALDLDFEELQLQGDMEELAGHLRELFSLPPAKRAERRAAVIERCKSGPQQWESVARRIVSRHPNVAALDAPLIERLSNWSRDEKVMRKPPRVKASPGVKVTQQPWNQDLSQHWWLIVVALVVLVNVGRLATNSNSSLQPVPGPVYQPFSQPPQTQYDSDTRRALDMILQSQPLEPTVQPLEATVDDGPPSEIELVPPDVDTQLSDEELYKRFDEMYLRERAKRMGRAAPALEAEPSAPAGANTP